MTQLDEHSLKFRLKTFPSRVVYHRGVFVLGYDHNTFYPDECDYYYSIAAIRLDLFVMHQLFHIFFTKSYLIKLL